MAHSIKIEDKLYNKLKAFCDLNDTTVYKLTQEALTEYLNRVQFGDAPFLQIKHGDKYHDENGHLIVTQMHSEDAEKMIAKILSENQDPDITKEQLEDVKETFGQGVDMIATVDAATGSDYTSTVEGVFDKDGDFEIKKTTIDKSKKRRL